MKITTYKGCFKKFRIVPFNCAQKHLNNNKYKKTNWLWLWWMWIFE